MLPRWTVENSELQVAAIKWYASLVPAAESVPRGPRANRFGGEDQCTRTLSRAHRPAPFRKKKGLHLQTLWSIRIVLLHETGGRSGAVHLLFFCTDALQVFFFFFFEGKDSLQVESDERTRTVAQIHDAAQNGPKRSWAAINTPTASLTKHTIWVSILSGPLTLNAASGP